MEFRLPIVLFFYGLGAVGLAIPIMHEAFRWTFDRYIYAEVAYDIVQDCTVGIFEFELGFLEKGARLPRISKMASYGTSLIDMILLKGPNFIQG